MRRYLLHTAIYCHPNGYSHCYTARVLSGLGFLISTHIMYIYT